MWPFTSSATTLATNRNKLERAESRLLEYAQKIGQRSTRSDDDNDNDACNTTMTVTDTEIPSSVLPLKKKYGGGTMEKEDKLFIHGVVVTRNNEEENHNKEDDESPLVLLHGYMNGALYFYKNLAGLSQHFPTVHSLDMLGCGLSSRPDFSMLVDASVETTESFFVESLECWRKRNNIEKMVLAGHSMGGYVAIAYAEKYPDRVRKLVCLSPAGIQELNEEKLRRFLSSISWTRRAVIRVMQWIFDCGITPGAVMRSVLSEARGRRWVGSYVTGRLSHAILDPEEQRAVADYLYTSSILPASAEKALNRILTSTTIARKPMIHRIPDLRLSTTVSFVYGEHDWMDIEGGIDVQRKCEQIAAEKQRQSSSSLLPTTPPLVDVYQIKKAGHLLMLENAEEFTNAVILACGGTPMVSSSSSSSSSRPPLPRKIDPAAWQSQVDANNWQRRR